MSNNILQKVFQPSQKGKVWRFFIFIIILTLAGGLVVFGNYYNKAVNKIKAPFPHIKEIPFRLGLDLLGGTQLIYQADVSAVPLADRNNAVEGVRDVIERRVNVFGVSEPNVQLNKTSSGDFRILVELAGVKDIKEAIKMIGETPLLEFKEQNTEVRQMTKDEKTQLDVFNKLAEQQAEKVLGKVMSGGDFFALAKQFSQDEKTKDTGGDLGWINSQNNSQIAELAKNITVGKTSVDLNKNSLGYEIIKVEDQRNKKDSFSNQEEKEVKASHLLICFTGVADCQSNLTKEQAYEKIKKLRDGLLQNVSNINIKNFANLVKQNSTEPNAKQANGDLGWFNANQMVKPFTEAVFAQKNNTISDVVETEFGYHLIYKQDERKIIEYKVKHILIKTKSVEDIIGKQSEWKNTELTGRNLKKAIIQFNHNDSSPEVSLEFDADGAKMFENITNRNIAKPVAIYLDSYPISVPTVNEKISGGKAVITGKFNIQEAKLLAQRLNAGALPVPINLVNQQTIGPSLGQKSVTDSLRSGIIGFIVIALFMILIYRLPGLLSVFALMVYSILVLAIFKLWPVTLTLSGAAGFIISIGMAVDANILIFSRTKEEIESGKSLSKSIDEGFKRAWTSIRDSNISTLITCFILIEFTSSVVKGFAITLALGVIVSMFTAIFITRNFLSLIPNQWLEKKHWLITSIKK
ncbi:MAG: protein translocase subunit SecD [Patescibacteria group bacterium]